MASFFFYLIAVIVSLLAGGILTFLIWGFFALIKDAIVKRGIPKGKKQLTEYLKENKEKYANPGFTTENQKEVQIENERRRTQKFREFERLRRTELKARIGKGKQNNNSTPGGKQLQQQRELLPNVASGKPKDDSPRNPDTKPRVKLDD